MPVIHSPDDPALDELCRRFSALAGDLDRGGAWPVEQLALCRDYGVLSWFFPAEFGGQGWDEADIVRGELKLSAACLTTMFILTQWAGACRRIVASENAALAARLAPHLLAGRTFATLGISHLTTSRRHLSQPALAAEEMPNGFRLNGLSPWVTGGRHAHTIVIGAELADRRRVLLALDTRWPGVRAGDDAPLIGLNASHTGPIYCDNVLVPRHDLIAGPSEDVMAGARGSNTGGLQTSTLAIGVAGAAVDFLFAEAERRADLLVPAGGLRAELLEVRGDLLAAALGEERCSTQDLRTRANSLVLRATQAALAAAKGTGYVVGHPAGRWCREALFFLVWSCPQQVMAANLCELAGLSE
ncbi:MAG: acyl-CoA dehydrogenase [Planctomycetota bacterium]|nr:MAG: acyl-CoA dehydrogenase [Planctomycetota bacterium]